MPAAACRQAAAWAACIKFWPGVGNRCRRLPASHQRSGRQAAGETGRRRRPSSFLRHQHDEGDENQSVLVPFSLSKRRDLAQREAEPDRDQHGDRLAEARAGNEPPQLRRPDRLRVEPEVPVD